MRLRWWVFLTAVIACAAALSWAAVSGPDPFPTHFGLSGRADRWQSRGRAVLQLALVAGALAVLFGMLSHFAPRLPRSMVNTPRRDYWLSTDNRAAFSRIIGGFFLQIGSLVLFLSATSTALSVVNAGASATTVTVIIGFVLAIAATVIHLFWTLLHPPHR